MEIHDLSAGFRDSESRLQADRRRWRRRARVRRARRQQVFAQPARVIVDQAKQMGFTGLMGAAGRAAAELGQVAERGDAAACPDQEGASPDDLLLMAAGKPDETSKLWASSARNREEENLLNPNIYAIPLGHRLPLLEYNVEDGRWYSMHHPFTAPHDEDIDKLERPQTRAVRAKAYDLV